MVKIDYDIMNYDLRAICLPVTLFIVNINSYVTTYLSKEKNKSIMIISYIIAIVGGLLLFFLKYGNQIVFEWVGLFTIVHSFINFIGIKSKTIFNDDNLRSIKKINKVGLKYLRKFFFMRFFGGILVIAFSQSIYFKFICPYENKMYFLSMKLYIIYGVSLIFCNHFIVFKIKNMGEKNNE